MEAVAVGHNAVDLAVRASLDDSSTRPADRTRTEAVLKQHALFRERVDIQRRIHVLEPTVVSADGVRCMIVREYEDDVGSIGGEGSCRSNGQKSEH
jgi:hypothetical protein